MIVITFINIKGGVAKTTSALSFAELLAELGYRVVVLDCDKQANATLSLLRKHPEGCLTTSDLLTAKEPIAAAAILNTPYGVGLIPANFSLIDANRQVLFEATSREYRFSKQLASIGDRFDYCIIDCPPDVNVGVTNALFAADHVLIPIRADRYGFDGLEYSFEAIKEAQEYNPRLKVVGCFLTMLNPNTNLTATARQLLTRFGDNLAFNTAIRQSTKVGESTFGEPLISYAPHSPVAEDYRALLKEYMERTGQA